MNILWIKLNQRDIFFGEFMLNFVLWHTTYVELLDNVIFISAQRWCENIFLMSSYVNQFNIGLCTILMCIKP
jgi:hypothetical protein